MKVIDDLRGSGMVAGYPKERKEFLGSWDNNVFSKGYFVLCIFFFTGASPELNPCITDGGPKTEILNLLKVVEILANLRFVGPIISRTNGLFYDVYMCIFSEICRLLARCSIVTNSLYNTLEKLQFWNLPVLNLLFFSSTSTSIQNCLLVLMEQR